MNLKDFEDLTQPGLHEIYATLGSFGFTSLSKSGDTWGRGPVAILIFAHPVERILMSHVFTFKVDAKTGDRVEVVRASFLHVAASLSYGFGVLDHIAKPISSEEQFEKTVKAFKILIETLFGEKFDPALVSKAVEATANTYADAYDWEAI